MTKICHQHSFIALKEQCNTYPAEIVQIGYIDSKQLLGELGITKIRHQGEFYQLRQTKAGKLILTK
ncbi:MULTISPECIES: hemin uptake protein HemP [Photorhabdus]|uniref:Hemin uptake protein HemP n=2 Tax=Photorhabdus luminescens TaxID=29488 RepID=A0A5C4REV6_PHOLU|nr:MULTISPECIES: hemin uptake protein HemP [Photorhabdus]MCW7546417.1 hemin uptake protein HemP [Photorhabdus aballayi]MCW7763974.1 hemin uptake protein HemP [Photorhabdus luminescens subsp. venezuelensis]TDB45374.1 hemin uptake protein HemP [Photorhabdus luminescens subsp. mexicana]TNH42157.1 hemin uptake protein HemP [Photorhabdus luminescens subsp. sonorensis]